MVKIVNETIVNRVVLSFLSPILL